MEKPSTGGVAATEVSKEALCYALLQVTAPGSGFPDVGL
jgi:hypothetical protein